MSEVQSSNTPGAGKSRAAAMAKTVTLRPRSAVLQSRKGEIIRAMRDASEAGQVAPIEWVNELAELVEIDLRRR